MEILLTGTSRLLHVNMCKSIRRSWLQNHKWVQSAMLSDLLSQHRSRLSPLVLASMISGNTDVCIRLQKHSLTLVSIIFHSSVAEERLPMLIKESIGKLLPRNQRQADLLQLSKCIMNRIIRYLPQGKIVKKEELKDKTHNSGETKAQLPI